MTAPAVLVGTFEPRSPEWHAARAEGLGGSDIAAVLGLSPYESRFSLWHRKAGRIGEQAESPEMEWGKRLEAAVVEKFADNHPELFVLPCGTYRHAERPWQIANPDRLLYRLLHCGGPGVAAEPVAVLEAKTSPFGDDWGPTGTDEIPVHVRAQLLWYCDVLGLPVGHVCVLIGGHDYREYVIRHDPAEAAQIRTAGQEFIDSLALGIRPDIDAHGATYQAIRAMHPLIDPTDVELDANLARRYCTARHALKAASDAVVETASLVADLLGNAHRARFNGQTIASRQARGDGIPYLVAGRKLPHFTEETTT